MRRLAPHRMPLTSLLAVLAMLAMLACADAAAQKSAAQKSAAQDGAVKAAVKPTLFQLRPAGTFADLPETSFALTDLLGGGVGKPKGFYVLLEALEKVKGKDACLLVDLSDPQLGLNLPQVRELERAFGKIKARGVKTVAWLGGSSSLHYQLACLCDRIMMADMGLLDLKAPSLEVMFMKDLLDLVGVQASVVRCGDFKGAVEPYVRSRMSEHLREHYRAMLTSFNQDLVERIASARKIQPDQVRKLQATRLFGAKEALTAGLIDDVTRWEDAASAFDAVIGGSFETKKIEIKSKKTDFSNPFVLFARLFAKAKKQRFKDDTVAVLHLSGAIEDGEKAKAGAIVSGPTARLARSLAADSKVKAVVVRVNSPGGSATASERILLALCELAQKKPVAFSMGRYAASGGYYVTCVPDTVVCAEPTTLTGSIGVFGLLMSPAALTRRVGLHLEHVCLDESADYGNPFALPNEKFMVWLQGRVDGIYDQFLGHVTRARGIARAQLLPIAGGRVWSGAQAKKLGLVHQLGGLETALGLVCKKAGIERSAAKLVHVPAPRNPLSALTDSFEMRGIAEAIPASARLILAGKADLLQAALPILLEGLRGGAHPRVWALAPVTIRN